jgi:formate C-acetyltransferase
MTVTKTSTSPDLLEAIGEPMAAAFLAHIADPPLLRACHALKRYYETCPLPDYSGEALYPCRAPLYGASELIQFHYSQAMCFNREALQRRIDEEQRREGPAISRPVVQALRDFQAAVADIPPVMGYTHSIIHFGRILREGLDSYRARIEAHLARVVRASSPQPSTERDRQFYEAMLILLDGIATLHGRIIAHLQADPRVPASLRDAFQRVPFAPATTFYEAMVATNFLFYLDGCDDLGRLDQDLWPYYRDDLAAGRVTPDEALAWIAQLFQNVDTTFSWNCAIGGTAADGAQGCNDLTMLCLRAAKGRRRPNLALRLRRDTPDEVWDQALDTISGGSGIPALYNEEEYYHAIAHADLGVAPEDLPHYAFGGCTELMIHGRSNVGSLDDTFNLALTLERSLHRHLPHCATFADFMARLKQDVSADIDAMCQAVNGYQETKARHQPQPLRTLLVDDCLDNGMEFNAGGARYNWSVICIAGLPNTYDSLAAIKQTVFEQQEIGAEELLQVLRDNFAGHEELRRRLMHCPHYGNNDPYVDDLAVEIAQHVFREFMDHTPWRGGRYLASCLMFVTYGHFGAQVGATPDGRLAYTPVADSAGAVQGRDRSGPTALLRSVARVPHFLAPGTLVINIRFTKRLFDDPAARAQLKALVRTYFDLGGMQLQINVVDQRILQEALDNPEAHRDLIVRVGGYSEYFHSLSRDLQLSVLERVEHEG